mgnify:CR=1 FL=1
MNRHKNLREKKKECAGRVIEAERWIILGRLSPLLHRVCPWGRGVDTPAHSFDKWEVKVGTPGNPPALALEAGFTTPALRGVSLTTAR